MKKRAAADKILVTETPDRPVFQKTYGKNVTVKSRQQRRSPPAPTRVTCAPTRLIPAPTRVISAQTLVIPAPARVISAPARVLSLQHASNVRPSNVRPTLSPLRNAFGSPFSQFTPFRLSQAIQGSQQASPLSPTLPTPQPVPLPPRVAPSMTGRHGGTPHSFGPRAPPGGVRAQGGAGSQGGTGGPRGALPNAPRAGGPNAGARLTAAANPVQQLQPPDSQITVVSQIRPDASQDIVTKVYLGQVSMLLS